MGVADRQRCGLLYLLTYDIGRKTGVELVVDELAPSDADLAAGEKAQALGQRAAQADAQRVRAGARLPGAPKQWCSVGAEYQGFMCSTSGVG